MASGILTGMEGRLGHAAWRWDLRIRSPLCLNVFSPPIRWLFYIEGALTIAIAVVAIFVLPDFPATTKWLTPQERALALKRLEEDVGPSDQDEAEQGGMASGFWAAVTDWKVWWLALTLTSETVALSFNAYFPTLSATMGFNRTITLLLCAPPFAITAIAAFTVSR